MDDREEVLEYYLPQYPQHIPENDYYQPINMPYAGQGSSAMESLERGYMHNGGTTPLGAIMMGNLLQGKVGLGDGIAGLHKSLQDQDKLLAYQGQEFIADDMNDLIQQGYGIDEARYAALTKYLLGQGGASTRAALGTTMPEYGKQADERAARVMDATLAAGGDYESQGQFGYTPLHVQQVSPSQGTMTVGGKQITGIAPEYLMSGVYGAIKGNGAGTDAAYKARMNLDKEQYQQQKDLLEMQYKTALLQAGIDPNQKGQARSFEQELLLRQGIVVDPNSPTGYSWIKRNNNGVQSGGNVTGVGAPDVLGL